MDIQTYRETKGLTQAQFGELLNPPATQASISHWETDRRSIPPSRAKAIEIATKGAITRHSLRPDLFDAPTKRKKAV